MAGSKRKPAAVTVAMALSLAAPAAADEKYGSMDEACAAADAACTAPVRAAPTKALYLGNRVDGASRGEAVTGDLIKKHALACTQDVDEVRCYDSLSQLGVAEHADVSAVKAVRARTKGRTRRRSAQSAHHACEPASQLFLFSGRSYDGDLVGLFRRGEWFTVPSWFDNRTSSYHMNNHSGHMSEHAGGLGNWYPGDTSVCAHQSIPLWYPHWNERISARYRN